MFRDKSRRMLVIGLLVALVQVVVLAGVFFFAQSERFKPAAASAEQSAVPVTSSLMESDIVANVVAQASPAVVKIETLQKVDEEQMAPFLNDPFFRQFFGSSGRGQTRQNVQKGLGSGFITSKDGYILTNEHVVSGATEIKVYLSDQEEPLEGKVVGSDAELDLAVLKVNAKKELPYLEFGDSEATQVGQWVIAIGNPYGLDRTVTTGVISAKGRPLHVQGHNFKDLLQTDAAINQGNSGGPLLDLNGKVVGINTAINAQAQGIGFAIPANTVSSVLDTLISKGKISHPWMGVSVQNVTPELAAEFGLESESGALIAGVVSGSPAERAGLQEGDAILEIGRQKVEDASDVSSFIEKSKVGDRVLLLVEHDGSRKEIVVTLAEKQ